MWKSTNTIQDVLVLKDLDYCRSFPQEPDLRLSGDERTLTNWARQQRLSNQNNGLNKHCLDLYLPKQVPRTTECNNQGCSSKGGQPPLVVFVHGGGWRRGDRDAWRHYLSRYDTNLLVAFTLRVFDLYANVGLTLAQGGVACAVISYPFAKLSLPWLLLEMLCSFLLSSLFCGLLILVPGCVIFTVYFTSLIERTLFPFNVFPSPAQFRHPFISGLLCFLSLAQVLTWIVVHFRREDYHKHLVPIISGSICFIWSIAIVTSVLALVDTELAIIIISLLTLFLTQGTLLYLHMYHIEGTSYPGQLECIADSVKWLMTFGQLTQLYQAEDLFLMGHSAGAHLVCMLALQQQRLQHTVAGLQHNIKGVISVCGVYDLNWLKNISLLELFYLLPSFGSNPEDWEAASPFHVLCSMKTSTPGSSPPPHLIFSAAWDIWLTRQAEDFVYNLQEFFSTKIQYYVVPKTDHFSIMSNFGRNKPAVDADQTMDRLCLDFIFSHTSGPPAGLCHCH